MENKSFEVLMKELEELVASLESGETRLDEALTLYKNGIGIIELLSKKLNDARKQIEIVGEKSKKDESNE
ncbi:MAG: exodeoxyribonuclease VII small subunit [Clostridiales bacterium]|nr:exodeoxyribonuclease VII small subunit [Clostridiales bacterium]